MLSRPFGAGGSKTRRFFRSRDRLSSRAHLPQNPVKFPSSIKVLFHFILLADVKVPNLKRKEVVSLIDAGLAINSGYPLVLDPERNVKLILSFDYSAGDPFEVIH